MKLALGKDFPSAPPKGYFLTKIFHPNVAANGEICVNTLKKDWKADLGIRHVLLVGVMKEEYYTVLLDIYLLCKQLSSGRYHFPYFMVITMAMIFGNIRNLGQGEG